MGIDAQLGVLRTPLKRALSRSKDREEASALFRKPRVGEEVIRAALMFCGIASIFTTIGIVLVLGQQALLFLNAEAWLPQKFPVVNDGQYLFELGENLAADTTTIPVDFPDESARRAYASGRYLLIENEIILIEERRDDALILQRGAQDTIAVAHAASALVIPMIEEQVRTLEALTGDETDANFNTILIDDIFIKQFSVGDRVRIGDSSETMVITAIEDNALIVDRGTEDFAAVTHSEDEQVSRPDRMRLGEFFTNTRWQPTLGEFGIAPLLSSTLITSFIAMMVAIPLGLGVAIYLSEYARPELRGVLKPVLEILAGIPTVVYGYFAIKAMTPFLQLITPDGLVGVYNMASAGIVMGIMILPTISSMSEDALNAVPIHLREASYGLGSTRLETTLRVVIPAALSGIFAAFIVGISRAVGETMIVAIAAGGAPNFTLNPFASAETMTGHIVRISKGDLTYNSVEYNSIFAIGITLFAVTLTLNLVSNWFVRRFREAY